MKNFPSIKKNEDFRRAYREGRKKVSRFFVMYVIENGLSISRLGISTSKKYGNSIERHHFQRRMRELFRASSDVTRTGYDIIMVARNESRQSDFSQMKEEYLKLLKGHDIFMESK